MMAVILICVSVILSSCRNILSKRISDIKFGTKDFFRCQGMLFLCGAVALLIFGNISWKAPSPALIGYAVIYALFLMLAQWCYTVALSRGNTATCSTVYSLGFILPTLSGAILFEEEFSAIDAIGVTCAALAVIISGWQKPSDKSTARSPYIIPLAVAMVASGGLGIVQKLQQRTDFAPEKGVFLIIAFLLAAVISFLSAIFATQKPERHESKKRLVAASVVGVCFGCCNLLNTTLAGMLPTAVFFPTLNIGVILLSMLLGICFFKEKLSPKEIAILSLGFVSILLLNLT